MASFQSTLLDRIALRGSADPELSFGEYREMVLRDLNWLFNTMNTEIAGVLADDSEETWKGSVLNYGIPSLCGQVSRDLSPRNIEKMFEQAIRRFEPRIFSRGLRVHCRQSESEVGNESLQVSIEAELWAQPSAERVYLQSEIDLETGAVRVSDSSGKKS